MPRQQQDYGFKLLQCNFVIIDTIASSTYKQIHSY